MRTAGHASREGARDRSSGHVVQGPQRERHEPDYLLMMAAVALSAIGILMVYSSGGHDAVYAAASKRCSISSPAKEKKGT